MSGFSGFYAGRAPNVPVPDAFFTVLLPQIDSLLELKVTLHLFWLLAKRRGQPKAVSLTELETDQMLLRSLKPGRGPRAAEDYLREGLELSVTRGTVLMLSLGNGEHAVQRWYLINTPSSRAALEQLQRDEIDPSEAVGTDVGPVDVVRIYRPNIFTLYERNIGVLTPLIADGLRDAELAFPPEWIVEAMRFAVEQNKRSWAYVLGILKRWEAEGKSSGTDRRHTEAARDSEKYIGGRYGHLVEP
ncbi:MAG: DnaD domain protein [Chloroflexi bacterium]|nr:DnaD domain protein [Chloroflexota bacterium]